MFQTAADAATYVKAGKATVTLKSRRTGTHFTYKVRKVPDKPGFFVSLLTGPDNETSFSFLGVIWAGSHLKATTKSCASTSAPSFRAFAYFWDRVVERQCQPPDLEVYHEGRCGRCNRKLTTPESVARGIGPECWRKAS